MSAVSKNNETEGKNAYKKNYFDNFGVVPFAFVPGFCTPTTVADSW